ncbi:electron transport complex subunit RsxG [Kaarinaea lacus]
MLATHMLRSAVLLTLFATAGTALVAVTYENTKEQIAQAEREAMLQKLHSVITPAEHTNDIFSDYITVSAPELLGPSQSVDVFRARMNGKPIAVLITPTAPDGYGGAIKLLVGIRYDGKLAGVRVLSHKETPGLGDAIEERRSKWIYQFDGLSLDNPSTENWKVQRDRGKFDQLTGATISSRAVVKSVRNTLEYYQSNKDFLFNEEFNKDVNNELSNVSTQNTTETVIHTDKSKTTRD